MPLNNTVIRNNFPALSKPLIFFDNPGGTQIAKQSLERMQNYLIESNSNHGGAFPTSQASDAILDEAHQAVADFLNAANPSEIIFGNNMTSLTFMISRSLSREWKSGDEILVTRLDHDANITPWVLAAQDREVKVNWVSFNLEDGTLKTDELQKALQKKPRLLAVGYASNSLGTINPIIDIVKQAHDAGVMVYVDAVHYAPHGPIDVNKIGCDFLVLSSYKFFGSHCGILYGRHEILEKLFAYKVRPASDDLPGKFETGTQNHEGIAGVLGALEYLEWLGMEYGSDRVGWMSEPEYKGRSLNLKKAMVLIKGYEYQLNQALNSALADIPGLKIYGLTGERRLVDCVPTYSFRLKDIPPLEVARGLAREGICVWDGNYYALQITEQLGLESSGGMVRVGAVHYNNLDEIEKLRKALLKIGS